MNANEANRTHHVMDKTLYRRGGDGCCKQAPGCGTERLCRIHPNGERKLLPFYMCFILVLTISLLAAQAAPTARAGNNVWTSTGPYGGDVIALAIDPTAPSTLYAGTGTSVFKSTDGGDNWNAVNTGLTNTYVVALAINPTTPTTLYAGTGSGVFESSDGGANWNAVNGECGEMALTHRFSQFQSYTNMSVFGLSQHSPVNVRLTPALFCVTIFLARNLVLAILIHHFSVVEQSVEQIQS